MGVDHPKVEKWKKQLGPIANVSGHLSRHITPSQGWVYVSDTMPRGQLSRYDFEGYCLVSDFSASLAAGLSATVFFLGLPKSALLAVAGKYGLISPSATLGSHIPSWVPWWAGAFGGAPGFWYMLTREQHHVEPKAALLVLGLNFGPQSGFSLSEGAGEVSIIGW
jgi:hypothetical protein